MSPDHQLLDDDIRCPCCGSLQECDCELEDIGEVTYGIQHSNRLTPTPGDNEMSEKHTAGPWRFVSQSDWPFKQAVHITAANWGVVATVNLDAGMPHLIETQRANLRLISAAPTMLLALRRAALALAFAAESSAAMQDDYEAVSAAIALATNPEQSA